MEWLLAEEGIFFLAALTASGLLLIGTLKRIRSPVRPRRPSPRVLSVPEDRAPSPPQDRAALALRLGRTLLDRALQDSDPISERRRRLIYRAIACLNRGIEAAPDDESLRKTLTAAHAALWTTHAQIGLQRLAQEILSRPTGLPPAPATRQSLKTDAAARP
jgi:hypothetical protein